MCGEPARPLSVQSCQAVGGHTCWQDSTSDDSMLNLQDQHVLWDLCHCMHRKVTQPLCEKAIKAVGTTLITHLYTSSLCCRTLSHPSAPHCSNVISTSSSGDIDALPGYACRALTMRISTRFMCFPSGSAHGVRIRVQQQACMQMQPRTCLPSGNQRMATEQKPINVSGASFLEPCLIHCVHQGTVLL